MTITPRQSALRIILVHPHFGVEGEANIARGPLPTHRLLRDRGHWITSTESLSAAVEQMEDETIDLLIVEQPDTADRDFEQRAMEQILSLPLDMQPSDVAFITPGSDTDERAPSLHGPRVHVLLKPLHVHGLLQMLRNLESAAI